MLVVFDLYLACEIGTPDTYVGLRIRICLGLLWASNTWLEYLLRFSQCQSVPLDYHHGIP